MLLGTSAEQVERLAEAVRNGSFQEHSGRVTLDLDVAHLTRVGQDNRTALIAQNMVEKGHGPEQATTEIDTLLALLSSVASVRAELSRDADMIRARVDLTPSPRGP